MSRHSLRVCLAHIRDHGREAMALVAGRLRADVESDRVLVLALVRLLEVIGEAAARVDPGDRELIQGIRWKAIVGLRNRLIHAYDDVDFEIVWRVLREDLPPLVEAVDHALDRLADPNA